MSSVSNVNSHLDSEGQASVLGHFTSFYDRKADQRYQEREQNAPELVQSFYTLVTDFYEYGYGECFHFAPIHDNMPMHENIHQYEADIAKTLRAKPGDTILDIGCGVGGPARNIGKFSGANVIGLNISDYQLKRARTLTAAAGLQDTVTFQKGDFCNMEQFEDNSVNGVYALESTCHSRNPLDVYKEVYRVLKPGGIFVDSAWAMTDKYQPGNPEHEKIKHEIVLGNGLPDLRTTDALLKNLSEAGLELVEGRHCENEGDLPWDTYLVGKGCFSIQSFRTSWLGRTCTHYTLSALEMVNAVPSGTTKVHSLLLTGADGLTSSRKAGIFTPMFKIVAKKTTK